MIIILNKNISHDIDKRNYSFNVLTIKKPDIL